MIKDIRSLLAIAKEQRRMPWLQDMLQVAVALELATIPPYLCAYWSVDENGPPGYIKRSLQRILVEEMRHLGFACNLLGAFHHNPEHTTQDVLPTLNRFGHVPVYPGPLPGGIHPGLTLSLGKLTKERIGNQFMQLEFPSKEAVEYGGKSFSTIGDFYQAIRDFITEQSPCVSKTHQIAFNSGLVRFDIIQTPVDALQAIEHISAEGEGADASPFIGGPIGKRELAHYYQFAEFFWQRTITDCGKDGWGFCGAPLPWPQSILDMADVPPGGYDIQLAFDCDRRYTLVLDLLTQAWAEKDPSVASDRLHAAVDEMTTTTDPNSLASLALQLMNMPRADAHGNYGPCFRLIR